MTKQDQAWFNKFEFKDDMKLVNAKFQKVIDVIKSSKQRVTIACEAQITFMIRIWAEVVPLVINN